MADDKTDVENFSNFERLYNRKFKGVFSSKREGNAILTDEQVYELAMSYFRWADNTPLKTPETANFQGRVYQGTAKKLRPFTILGLSTFIGITPKTWREWKHDETRPVRQEIVELCENIIYEQKYSAAMVGAFNPAFVLKDLDMDKSTVKSIGDPDQPIYVKGEHDVTISEELIESLMRKL